MSFISNYKIIDTNVLLDFPHILDEPNLIIASDVLRELDGLKLNKNSEVAFKSRRAAILISKNLKGLTFDNSLEKSELNTDDKLLELTKSYAGELITNDVYLKLKAIAAGIRNSGYGNRNDYTGVFHWDIDVENEIDKKDMRAMIEEHVLPTRFSLKENEFLMAHNQDDIATFIYQNNELKMIHPKAIKNKWINKITPKNPEQVCLFNLLLNPEITIVYAGGKYGSG